MMREYNYFIYIMGSTSGTLYIGFTNNLARRIEQHKNKSIEGFTKKYSCNKLLYYEHFSDANIAIGREKEIKKWRREKKEKLINSINPHWNDLSGEMY